MGKLLYFNAAAARRLEPAGRPDARQATIEAFLVDLQLAGRSPRTLEQHRAELRRYMAWLDDQAPPIAWDRVTRAELAAYARTRAARSASSRASLIVSMRVFYRWAAAELLDDNPADRLPSVKRSRPAPRAMTVDQVRQLRDYLAALVAGDVSPRIWRDHTLLVVALYTGARAAELAALTWHDVDQVAGVMTIRHGKGDRGRAIKLAPDAARALDAWLVRYGGADRPVFSLTDRPIRADRVSRIVRMHADAAGLDQLTAHVFRHTFATKALRESGNLHAVSRALGHAHLSQTQVYIRGDTRDSDPAIDALPPLDQW